MGTQQQKKHSNSNKTLRTRSRGQPHPHADIHNQHNQQQQTTTPRHGVRGKRPRRPSALNVYQVGDDDDDEDDASSRPSAKRASVRDARYDWSSQDNYQYELPDEWEDEEIEEEQAFNEQEQDKYGELVQQIQNNPQKQKGTRAARHGTTTEEDDEKEMEDEEDEEGGQTLSELLDEKENEEDMSAHETFTSPSKPRKHPKQQQQQQQLQQRNPRQQEPEVTEDILLPSEEEEDDSIEDDDEEHARLLSVVRRLTQEDAEHNRGAKRTKQQASASLVEEEQQGLLEESEFSAVTLRSHNGTIAPAPPRLTMQDLMNSLQTSAAKKSITDEPLSSSSAAASSASSAAVAAASRRAVASLQKKLSRLQSTVGTVAEPLPEIRQEEITRQVGYTQAKAEIEKWTPIIQRNAATPHLKFPLNEPPRLTSNTASLQAKFTVNRTHQLEADLAALTQQYQLHKQAPSSYSTLLQQENAVLLQQAASADANDPFPTITNADDIEQRRIELSKYKSLLFFHELKMQRMNKIKSKTYRKLRRQLKHKGGVEEQELDQLDEEAKEKKRYDQERQRVLERMSLSHSNTSQWMTRQMRMNRNVQNGEVKQALQHTVRLAQQLKKKQASIEGEEEEEAEDEDRDTSAEEEDQEDEEEDQEDQAEDNSATHRGKHSAQMTRAAELRATLGRLERLKDDNRTAERQDDQEEVDGDAETTATSAMELNGFADPLPQPPSFRSSGNKSNLLGLKFMQRAVEKKKQQTREAIEEYEEEVKQQLQEEEEEDGEEEEQDERHAGKHTKKSMVDTGSVALHGRQKIGTSESNSQQQSQEMFVLSTASVTATASSEQQLLLPHSFQTMNVGLSRGKKLQSRTSISIDIDAAPASTDQLFAVEAFPEDEEQVPAPFTGNNLVPSVTLSGSSSKSHRNNGVDGQPVQHDDSVEGNENEEQEAGTALDDANPWAQSTDISARQELRAEEQTKRRRKRSKPKDTHEAKEVVKQVDVNAPLLISQIAAHNSHSVSFNSFGSNQAQQAALVREAFATAEDEQKNFAAAKASLVESELPSVSDADVSGVVPGWGNWAGAGVTYRPPSERQLRVQRQQLDHLRSKRNSLLKARSDADLDHVIISEKTDKKASKYLLPRLPFPYTNPQHYEASLMQPLGKEWNTQQAYQQVITPNVIVKPGAIIAPITYHTDKAEAEREEDVKEAKKWKERMNGGNEQKGKEQQHLKKRHKRVGKEQSARRDLTATS